MPGSMTIPASIFRSRTAMARSSRRLADGLPIRTGVAATRSRRHARRRRGRRRPRARSRAKAAIVAVPARMLETGRLAHRPGLPAAHRAGLPRCADGLVREDRHRLRQPVFEGFDPPYADIFDPVAPDHASAQFRTASFRAADRRHPYRRQFRPRDGAGGRGRR